MYWNKHTFCKQFFFRSNKLHLCNLIKTVNFISYFGGLESVRHSFFISADGDLYVWGWNESGQLGLRHSALEASDINTTDAVRSCSLLALPEPAVVSGDALVIKTSCGSRHTAAITGEAAHRTVSFQFVLQQSHLYYVLCSRPVEVQTPCNTTSFYVTMHSNVFLFVISGMQIFLY